MTDEITRRNFLVDAALVSGGVLLTQSGSAALAEAGESQSTPPAAFTYEPKPLLFNPSKLKGISEKLIVSHHDKNYAGAVKRLGSIQAKIAALPKDAPPFMMGGLKREELVAMNSMILHELYFANLGGSGKSSGTTEKLINTAFGSVEAWEHDFKLTASSLSGGSGWVVLAYSPRDKRVHNVWSSDHLVNLAFGTPLLVMDMYEHSYQMDYGADAKAYIDAFLTNVNWEEVESRAPKSV
jgi:Fe-Mn family superoxide dismutase